MDGANEVVKQAATHGWEAGLLAVIVVAVCLLAGYLVRRILEDGAEREKRMSDRVTKLEEYVSNALMTALRDCTAALVKSNESIDRMSGVIERLAKALDDRPCFWSPEHQKVLSKRDG